MNKIVQSTSNDFYNLFVKKNLNKPNVPATITKICDRPRSYELELENNRKIERNRKHIFGPINDNLSSSYINNNVPESILVNRDNLPIVQNDVSLPKNDVTQNNDIICNQQSVEKPVTQTRSGRAVKTPKYLSDYETK